MLTSRDAPFPSSQWSRILSAGRGARDALEDLAARYWRPVYTFVRRSGRDRHAAEDLTQEFFAFLLEGEVIATADPGRGRFRAFLRQCLRNFLANERDRGRAQKRGGGLRGLSLDVDGAESYLAASSTEPPDAAFDRAWARETLDRAIARLKESLPDQARQIFALACGDDPAPHHEIAQRFGMTESAVGVTVHRVRQRLRQLLVEEVRQTVHAEPDCQAEVADLLRAIGNP